MQNNSRMTAVVWVLRPWLVAGLVAVLLTGCAVFHHAPDETASGTQHAAPATASATPPPTPAQAASPESPVTTVPPSSTTEESKRPSDIGSEPPAVATAPVETPASPATATPESPKAAPPKTKPAVTPDVSASAQQATGDKVSSAPAVETKSPPPLDLDSLETRLRETDAIGLFTKIALKNQVNDLLDKFRDFYQGRAKTTLAQLRRPYEMLIMKVLALLQDEDPALAHDVLSSREAIWNILSDPKKFASLSQK